METVSTLLAICAGNSPVPGEFPTQRPVTRGCDVFFDLRPDKRLSKQSRGWWFETPSHSLWRHRNDQLWNMFPNTGHPTSVLKEACIWTLTSEIFLPQLIQFVPCIYEHVYNTNLFSWICKTLWFCAHSLILQNSKARYATRFLRKIHYANRYTEIFPKLKSIMASNSINLQSSRCYQMYARVHITRYPLKFGIVYREDDGIFDTSSVEMPTVVWLKRRLFLDV